ncbi:MAG: malectin domain-containing carbohydrate-binding protein [Dehalococcoidia bacterium]|nr:malectin domain-containing carbohydrate-binding protein [Dehalococcoidia bacterium]
MTLAANTDSPPDTGETVYRVNAGGSEISGTPAWSADSSGSPSPYVNTGNTYSASTTIDMTDPSVPAGTPVELFQSERYDPSDGAEMQWDFPVENATYQVDLFFAEIFSGAYADGARVFDVFVEGGLVLPAYDIYADVGAATAVVKSFEVAVEDGNIDIDFGHITENPAIKGIQVARVGGQPNVLGLSAGTLQFGELAPGETASQPVSLSNRGDEGDPVITVSEASIGGTNADEFAHDFAAPVELAPGDELTVTVTHTASEASGAKSAGLSFVHTGDDTPSDVQLEATTTEPAGPTEPGSVVYRVNAGGDTLSGSPGMERRLLRERFALRQHWFNLQHIEQHRHEPRLDPGRYAHGGIPVRTLRPCQRRRNAMGLPVEDGFYRVDLYFSEIFTGAFSTGARVSTCPSKARSCLMTTTSTQTSAPTPEW